VTLPNANQAAVDSDDRFTAPWRKWFASIERQLAQSGMGGSDVSTAIAAIATALGSSDGSVENIPAQHWLAPFTIRAGANVSVVGTPEGGSVLISATSSGGGSTGGAIGCTFDGGGAVLIAGSFCDVLIPFDCSIDAATLLADQSGSLVISVWSDTYASYPPTGGDNIAASAPPTLSSALKSRDTTLTGWTKTLTKGSTLRFTVTSCAVITRATLTLEVTKT
jgi:hypothetical protein